MSKNVLVLTGSPRRGGNSDLLADALIKGAQAAGHTVTKYTTADKRIAGCRACRGCYTMGRACVIDDDFNALAPLVEQADVLVFATPLYWFSVPAQLKAAIDRFYALDNTGRLAHIRESALLACAATTDMPDFDGLVRAYQNLCGYKKWTDRGVLLAPGVEEKGDVAKTDLPARAEALGAAL